MSSFFLKTPQPYLEKEIKSRSNTIVASTMKPWIRVHSNIGSGKTLSSVSATQIFGGINSVYDKSFKPNPIVSEFSIDFSARGTLRRGSIKIECFSVSQFEEMQKYFMEPGASIFVQWGWNKSASDSKKSIPLQSEDVNTQLKFYRAFDELYAVRDNSNGCYDNMLGIINKAESSISGGTFIITCKIVSLGELLAGRTPSDPDTSDPNAVATNFGYLSLELSDQALSPDLHWKRFYNSLPDGIRKLGIGGADNKSLPSHVNPGTDFINYDEEWTEEVKKETTDEKFEYNSFVLLNKKFSPKDKSSPVSPNRYVRFETFCWIFNEVMVKSLKAANGILEYKIDIGTRENPKVLCTSFKRIFSISDSVFIPNKTSQNWLKEIPEFRDTAKNNLAGENYGKRSEIDNSVQGYNGEIISFPRETPSCTIDGKTYTFKPYGAGWIGDLYIEHELAMQVLNNTSSPIKDNLDGLLEEMATAVDGMWNFQIKEETDGKKMKYLIVDANLLNNGSGDTSFNPIKLNIYGKDGVLIEGNFNFDIPKGMANQIVMSKTAPSDTNMKQPGLRGLFSSDKDPVLEAALKVENAEKGSTSNTNGVQGSDTQKEDAQRWANLRSRLRLLLQPKVSRLSATLTKIDLIEKYWIPGISIDKSLFNNLLKRRAAESYSPILPLKINFTILGISGFRFGDTIELYGLPEKYNGGANGFFMVTEVTHKVDNDLWTTEIECMFRPSAKP